MFSNLFNFKTIIDEKDNEYVVFSNNKINKISDIADKTQFEATENHIHLYDKVKKRELEELTLIGQIIGKSLLCVLKSTFPQKKFIVYVSITIGDSMIIRFHQKWQNESLFYDDFQDVQSNETILMFE